MRDAGAEDMNRAAERMARVNQESLRALAEGALAVQRQNAKLYREWAELSSAMVEESVRMCFALSRVPFSYVPVDPWGSGGNGDEDLPVPDYDRLDVDEVVSRLEGLTAREVEKLEEYEKHHKNRPVVVERMDRSLV